MQMARFDQIVERFFFRQIQGRSEPRQVVGFAIFGFLIILVPYVFQLAVFLIIAYSLFVTVGPMLNPRITSPFDGRRPPIAGKKWDDFDQEMQAILRSYDRGEVKPTGKHVAEWNKAVRKREATKRRAVQAALDLKAARARARNSAKTPLSKVARLLRIPNALQFAEGRYSKAKKEYQRNDQLYSGNIIKKTKPTTEEAPASEMERRDDEYEEALMLKLKNLKDEPVSGEVLDLESQLGERGPSRFTPAETTWTRTWPKGIARTALPQRNETEAEEEGGKPLPILQTTQALSKERRAMRRIEQEAKEEAGSGFTFFGATVDRKTVNKAEESERFGIPAWAVITPVVLATFTLCFQLLWIGIRFVFAFFLCILTLSPLPLIDVTDHYIQEAIKLVGGLSAGTADVVTTLEIVALTARDLLFDIASFFLSLLTPLFTTLFAALPPAPPRASPNLKPPPIMRTVETPAPMAPAGVETGSHAFTTVETNRDPAEEASGDVNGLEEAMILRRAT